MMDQAWQRNTPNVVLPAGCALASRLRGREDVDRVQPASRTRGFTVFVRGGQRRRAALLVRPRTRSREGFSLLVR
jgi:hypothetical protein